MASIDQLERKVLELERRLNVEAEEANRLMAKSNKVLEIAKNAYKLDGYGYVWQYDPNKEKYYKTNMRVMTPEIAERAILAKNIADNAIEGRHIADDVIEGRMIKQKTIDGRSMKPDTIGPEHIQDDSVLGDRFVNGAFVLGKLADNAVATRNIINKSIIMSKLDEELQNMILSAGAHGVTVAGEFGDSPIISVSQKALTDAFVKVWQKLEDMTGEMLQGISMTVSPDYFIGEDGADIHITANTVDTNGIFEHIAFYSNGALLTEASNVDYFEHDLHIDETTVIMCKAKIMGVEYTRQSVITHYNSFWLGAGDNYSDIMDVEHVIPITNGMRGAYDVNVNEGDNLFIVVGGSLAQGFLRADMNSIEIPFTESTVEIDGETYKVYTSVNTYNAGTYNIDING